MPVSMAKIGQEMPIVKISGKDESRRFLESLGLVVGEKVTVVSEIGGNIILNVKNTRVAIDKSMANRIIV
ncbi:MAG: ferrous iron transport protein [Oscillospiraceae bacterium]|nr:ferrous iron transport protein [Oscillospiraceae bacterium]